MAEWLGRRTWKSGGPGFKLSTLTLIGFIHVFSEFNSLGALCKTQLVCLLLVGIFKHYIYSFIHTYWLRKAPLRKWSMKYSCMYTPLRLVLISCKLSVWFKLCSPFGRWKACNTHEFSNFVELFDKVSLRSCLKCSNSCYILQEKFNGLLASSRADFEKVGHIQIKHVKFFSERSGWFWQELGVLM